MTVEQPIVGVGIYSSRLYIALIHQDSVLYSSFVILTSTTGTVLSFTPQAKKETKRSLSQNES